MGTLTKTAFGSARSPDLVALDELNDLIAHGDAEAIIAFRPSREAHARFYALMDAEKNGEIGEAELQELNRCMEFEHFMRVAKIQARVRIQERETAA